MTALVRILVVWLLALALPVQGFAAATMSHCAGGHHDSAAAVTAGGHDHSMHMHASDAVGGMPDMASHDGSAPSVSSVEIDKASSPAATKHPKVALSKCSACAVCCSVAYLPTAVLAFPPSVPVELPAIFQSPAPAAFFTDGPDRPPRLLLA